MYKSDGKWRGLLQQESSWVMDECGTGGMQAGEEPPRRAIRLLSVCWAPAQLLPRVPPTSDSRRGLFLMGSWFGEAWADAGARSVVLSALELCRVVPVLTKTE